MFNELKLEQHPDKTFIGRTMRGFDFLGYHFKPGMVCVAEKTVCNFKKHIDRLYEQGADLSRIGQYVKKWVQWVKAGGIVTYSSYIEIVKREIGISHIVSPSVLDLVEIPRARLHLRTT